jgi:ketosteroid isomerase-like protein
MELGETATLFLEAVEESLMTRLSPVFFLFLLLALAVGFGEGAAQGSSPGEAWSQNQVEVWATVEELWRVSSDGDLESWFALVSDDFRGWSNADPAPLDKEAARHRASLRVWKRIFYHLHPLAIDIHGDVAIVFYSFLTETEYPDGTRTTATGKWTDIFRKEGDRWLLIADSGGS